MAKECNLCQPVDFAYGLPRGLHDDPGQFRISSGNPALSMTVYTLPAPAASSSLSEAGLSIVTTPFGVDLNVWEQTAVTSRNWWAQLHERAYFDEAGCGEREVQSNASGTSQGPRLNVSMLSVGRAEGSEHWTGRTCPEQPQRDSVDQICIL